MADSDRIVLAGTAPLPRSLWAATARPPIQAPPLAGAAEADAVVVGGGFTGLSAALHLAERGWKPVLLEAAEPGWGASGRNGGQIIAGLKASPAEILAKYGRDRGKAIVDLVGGTADFAFDLIQRHRIACDASRPGWVQAAHSEAALRTVAARCADWQSHGAPVRIAGREEMARILGTGDYVGGLIDARGGAINPLGYARGLADAAQRLGARIHGGSPVTAIERQGQGWRVRTAAGHVDTARVLIGTNAYTTGFWPGLAQSVVPVSSFQIATAPIGDNLRRTILPEGHVLSDTRRLLRYFRLDPQGRLVMGGRGTFKDDPDAGDTGRLRRWVGQLFPALADIAYEHHWAGRVAVNLDHWPHLHALAPGVWAGLGYNGRGVAMASRMGALLADLAAGVPPEQIAFPITPLRPIPLHGMRRAVLPVMTAWYGVLDRIAG
ncbi:NAD(P)/FAD-dependent oxidoreductase [Stella sp.]|uniref:NAD(P)/FAD-dependent oxidoreductase n=1 Tax=Stella sp. TaxID=2912054 RepID=UPI0035AF4FD6